MSSPMSKVSALTSAALQEYLNNRKEGRLVEFLADDPTDFTTAPEQIWVNTTDDLLKYTSDGGVSISSLDNLYINVKAYGAKGDGIADDTTEIQSAITAASTAGGGIVFFPVGKYLCTSQLTIPSHVTLRGVAVDKNGYLGTNGSILKFNVSTITNIDGIRIAEGSENIGIFDLYIDGGSTTYNGISFDGGPSSYITHITMERVFSAHSRNVGIYGEYFFLVTMNDCQSQFNNDGFWFNGGGTTLNINRCYALNNVQYGYYISAGFVYCNFINCAADANRIGYKIKSNTTTLLACGGELSNETAYDIDTATQITLIGCMSDRSGLNDDGTQNNTTEPSFAKITNSQNIEFRQCKDNNPQSLNSGSPSIRIVDALSVPVMFANYTFPNGITDVSNRSLQFNQDLKIGLGKFINNNAASGVFTFEGSPFATKALRNGVLNSSLNAWLAFFDSDGKGEVTSYFRLGKVTPLPSPTAADRGRLIRVEGGAGVADTLHICEKNASEAYIWRQI